MDKDRWSFRESEGGRFVNYQKDRRRYTRAPGYHAVMPRVFPFYKTISYDEMKILVRVLWREELTGFAVTSHPSSMDGSIRLWLSQECAEVLVGGDWLDSVMEAN